MDKSVFRRTNFKIGAIDELGVNDVFTILLGSSLVSKIFAL